MVAKKPLEQWLYEYGASHQNPTNKKIHAVCVPIIFWTIIAFLYRLKIGDFPLGIGLMGLALIFYFRLKWTVGLAMSLAVGLSYGLCEIVQRESGQLLWISLILFVLAWIGQFVGHKIEGQKPSFFEDVQYLLIGPLWVFKHLC